MLVWGIGVIPEVEFYHLDFLEEWMGSLLVSWLMLGRRSSM